jgi:hypothetical protein
VLVASSGAAVADSLVVIEVIVLEDGLEVNRLDDVAEELNCDEEEGGGTLGMG